MSRREGEREDQLKRTLHKVTQTIKECTQLIFTKASSSVGMQTVSCRTHARVCPVVFGAQETHVLTPSVANLARIGHCA